MSAMDFEQLNIRLSDNSRQVEEALEAYFASKREDSYLKTIKSAQTYSLMGGGKRIRPFLVNEVCRMLGGSEKASMPFAVAVEMVHTYSLIHDDLPCMDDDDIRRGKPSNHKVFGEGAAVLAGDALLTNAFSAMLQNTYVTAQVLTEALRLLSEAAGDSGMIGGQIIDIENEGSESVLSFDELLLLHSLKTGKMIEVSAALGALAAGYLPQTARFVKVCEYASKIGLAFQVVDDLLDVIGDEATVGKSLASDKENGKTTFMSFFDVEGASAYAERLTNEAIGAIATLDNSEMLSALAIYLLNRKS